MNKTLKFDSHLIPLIFSGEKKNTWRLFDDKDLKTGDVVDFLDTNSKEKFTTARLTQVEEKPFSELNTKDWEGHEKYEKPEDMYKYYTTRYRQDINPDTKLKVVWFEII